MVVFLKSVINLMAQDIASRVNYLQAIGQVLGKTGQLDDLKLSSYYGFLSKEICMKNQLSSFNWEKIKRETCGRCYSPLITCCEGDNLVNFVVKNKFFMRQCKQCGWKRKIKIDQKVKTYYEKILAQQEENQEQA